MKKILNYGVVELEKSSVNFENIQYKIYKLHVHYDTVKLISFQILIHERTCDHESATAVTLLEY